MKAVGQFADAYGFRTVLMDVGESSIDIGISRVGAVSAKRKSSIKAV